MSEAIQKNNNAIRTQIKKTIQYTFTEFLEAAYYIVNPFHKLTNYLNLADEKHVFGYIDYLKEKKKFFTDASFNEIVSLAISKNREDVAYYLLEIFPDVDINKGYQQGWFLKDNLLALACENHSSYRVIDAILKRIDPNTIYAPTSEHPNILLAYLNQDMKLIDLMVINDLIECGIDLHQKVKVFIKHQESFLCSPLDLAIINEEENLIDLILEKGLKKGVITPEDIQKAQEIYEQKTLGHKEKATNARITHQLNNALIVWEKEHLQREIKEDHVWDDIENVRLHKKNKQKTKI
jgi:hypothetical protein